MLSHLCVGTSASAASARATGMITYFARNGQEILLRCEADYVAAIRSGALHGGSLVMDCRTGRWTRAAEHVELAALLERIPVEAPVPPPSAVLKAGVSALWIPAIVGPALIARALHADAPFVLALTLTCALALCAAGIAVRLLIRSRRGRWRLSLVLAILTFAAGAGSIIVEVT